MIKRVLVLLSLGLALTLTLTKVHAKPNAPHFSKTDVDRQFHDCLVEAWNLQWQNHCVTTATSDYKKLIPPAQRQEFHLKTAQCTTDFQAKHLDEHKRWQILDCEMAVAKQFAR